MTSDCTKPILLEQKDSLSKFTYYENGVKECTLLKCTFIIIEILGYLRLTMVSFKFHVTI